MLYKFFSGPSVVLWPSLNILLTTRYGDEHKLAGFSATLQAIISFVENGYMALSTLVLFYDFIFDYTPSLSIIISLKPKSTGALISSSH